MMSISMSKNGWESFAYVAKITALVGIYRLEMSLCRKELNESYGNEYAAVNGSPW